MNQSYENLQDEVSDLGHELERFQKEKDRVRAIVGKIGGVPKFRTKLINVLLILLIVSSVIGSIIGGEKMRLLMIELATVTLSIKIIYMILSNYVCQAKASNTQPLTCR